MLICYMYEIRNIRIEFCLVYRTSPTYLECVKHTRTSCKKCFIDFKFCAISTCDSAKRFTYDDNKNSIFLQCFQHIDYLIAVKTIANQHTYFLCICITRGIVLAKRRITCRYRYMGSGWALDPNL